MSGKGVALAGPQMLALAGDTDFQLTADDGNRLHRSWRMPLRHTRRVGGTGHPVGVYPRTSSSILRLNDLPRTGHRAGGSQTLYQS